MMLSDQVSNKHEIIFLPISGYLLLGDPLIKSGDVKGHGWKPGP